MELSWEESLSQSRRLPLLQVVSNNKSFSVGVQSPTDINAPQGCAEKKHADVIVFEYLETKGKISGRKKQKLHLWRKRDIKKRCEHQVHRRGMRISRICAWNTSRLAYDGSGTVVRDPGNHSLCTFQNGKSSRMPPAGLQRLYQLGGDWLPPLILACFSPPIGESHLPTDIYNLFTIFIAIVIFNVSRETYISIACLYQKSHTLQYKTINN